MIVKLTALFFCAVVLLPGMLPAMDGVDFEIRLYQFDSTVQENILLFSDTAGVVAGIPATGYIVALSMELRVTEIDTNRVTFEAHVVTLGPPAHTESKGFTVEYGLPAVIGDIEGKGAARYALWLVPLGAVEIDTSLCPFNSQVAGTFSITPTAHTDLYVVPNSLGDYYSLPIRDFFEGEYRAFKQLFNLGLPGKYNLFICPCAIHNVIWDQRFAMSIDPTRSTAYVIVSVDGNSADPFALLQAAVLRNMGYAPPFLSEGLAGYFSFASFDMRQVLAENRAIPLVDLFSTIRYFNADPVIADRTAASFVKFLIDNYSMARFQELYRSSDDLNLAERVEHVYGRTVADLEASWKTYVDTVPVTAEQFRLYAERAEQMRDYRHMQQYAEAYLAHAATEEDSVASLNLLKRVHFFTGDYYRATEVMETLTRMNPESSRNWMELAAYRMMNGYYEQARADLMKASSLDSTDQLVTFNLALNHLVAGERDRASELLFDVVTSPSSAAGREARVLLADILRTSDNEDDRALAVTYLKEAIAVSEQELRIRRASAAAYLWSGMAHLGLGETDVASELLDVALFLETRPFYIGLIYLSLGKVADVLGDRAAARDFYGRVLAVASSDYHQKEARQYLDHPYRR